MNVRLYYGSRNLNFKFRCDPVPFTGRYKNRVRPCFRNPKTTNERRQVGSYTRAKRSFSNLPNAWDDMQIADNYIRSWKRTKKTRQWE
jgi:hypothetical protein